MKQDLSLFLKGAAMGAANVIPGVSGGTIAFITGVYEPLIQSLKSFDLVALKLILARDFKGFAERVNLRFLVALMAGVLVSVVTLAKLLKWLMSSPTNETLVWAFFFGLILGSIPFVGKMVNRWSPGPVVGLLFGAVVAAGISLMTAAEPNQNPIYLGLCGVVAMCSMIVPGLSGSYVLMLMGNYQLIMLDSVNALRAMDLATALPILIPVGIGAVIGLVAFAHLLGWIFKRFHDVAVALLTGFVAGSLLTIWPWKKGIPMTDASGAPITKDGKEKIGSYEWQMPSLDGPTFAALGIIALGILAIVLVEKAGASKPSAETAEN